MPVSPKGLGCGQQQLQRKLASLQLLQDGCLLSSGLGRGHVIHSDASAFEVPGLVLHQGCPRKTHQSVYRMNVICTLCWDEALQHRSRL